MKKQLINPKPLSLFNLLFVLTFFISFTSFAQYSCGEIDGFQFSNGSESTEISNGGEYDINTLPNNFFIDIIVNGYSQSARYIITNLDTDQNYTIVENQLPYTYPAGGGAWDLGVGNYKVKAKLHLFNNARGRKCDQKVITFSITEALCNPSAGTLTADANTACLVEGTATISATPNGDINIPEGYTSIYVLTQGSGLVIVGAGAEPSFEVTEGGNYTIHTLVYDAATLDLGIITPGVTTGVDVLGLLTQGGGDICANLDVAGAPVSVSNPSAGTLTADADTACLVEGTATISATPNGDINIPEGYTSIYVLTQGSGLVIVGAGAESSFEVTEGGNYTIHTLVYDAATLDLGIITPGVTTGVDVLGLLTQGGGDICANLDVAGAPVSVSNPSAGTLTADADTVQLVDGTATISATPNGDINIPEGYTSIYVLTQGSGLVIVGAGAEPSFEVSEGDNYTIHTLVYDAATLDLGIITPGVTTGVDVLGLITQGGGDICANLDVAGAPISVIDEEECDASAGTLTADADTACLVEGIATISATPNGDINIPEGYTSIYVLTQGSGLVIVGAGAESSFEVTEGGNYTIHTLVYDAATLDLGIITPGVTTGVEVLGLLTQGGGDICANLDVAGAPVSVSNPSAGTLTADADTVQLVDGTATVSATPNGDINIPEGYTSIYVLTQGSGLVIVGAGAESSFEVSEGGNYTIHTLVYDAATLDLGIITPGVTTGVDVLGLITQGGGDICANLDVAGAPISVIDEEECAAYAGTMYSSNPINCLSSGSATIEALQNEVAIIPEGYQQLFVLTEAFSLTILGVSATPDFEVNSSGFYRIHSLVYNPGTLDLSVVEAGVTTGFDVVNIITENNICASLDVDGALNLVIGNRWFCYFFDYYNRDGVTDTKTVNGFVNEYDSFKSWKRDYIDTNSEIKLYPNPVINDLNIDVVLFDDEIVNYSIFDLSGRQISAGIINASSNGKKALNVNALQSGMYLVNLESDYRTMTKKIQVIK